MVKAMEPPPTTTYPSHLLNSPKYHHSLPLLKQTHAQLIKHGLSDDNYIAGTLIKHYSNPNHLTFPNALKVFDQVPHPHVFLFNSLIKACFENNQPLKCISSYRRMLTHGSKPNKYTFPTLFNACTATGAVAEATQLHAQAIKLSLGQDRYTTSAAIQMYAALGFLVEARRMLDTGAGLDPVCWNAMIDGLLKNGEVAQARELFDVMPSRNTGSWNAMVSGYARHGLIDEARTLFDQMPKRDEVSWSAMIDGYIQCGRSLDALTVFRHMLSEQTAPKKFVLSSVIAACADVGALEQGRWIHAYVERNSMCLDAVVGTSLIDMYAKCGRLDLARQMFEEIACKKVFCWNAMIGGLAMHGCGTNALELFWRMQGEGFVPNAITFVGVLNACAHAGLVDDANKIFTSIEREYGVTPTVEHYGCMVNLLGRAGQFHEAEDLIASMPMKPNAAVWGALLGGCRIHGNVELGKRVGERLIELEPENSGRYTLLSNIYAREGIWDDVLKVRKLMKDRGVKTIRGSSLIEVDGVVHEFIVGDGSHPSSEVVYLMLKEIVDKLRLEGYAPNTSEVLFDIDEEEKESAICYHSEKLAIAFGLLNTSPGTMVRIVKNLRVCEDCHSATKLISRLYNREIIVRDRARFHHFRDGICSCMDFW